MDFRRWEDAIGARGRGDEGFSVAIVLARACLMIEGVEERLLNRTKCHANTPCRLPRLHHLETLDPFACTLPRMRQSSKDEVEVMVLRTLLPIHIALPKTDVHFPPVSPLISHVLYAVSNFVAYPGLVTKGLSDLAWTENSRKIATASDDKLIKIFDVETVRDDWN